MKALFQDIYNTLNFKFTIFFKTSIHCSARTLYRQFKEKIFDETTLPMKGKRKPNGYKERRGK